MSEATIKPIRIDARWLDGPPPGSTAQAGPYVYSNTLVCSWESMRPVCDGVVAIFLASDHCANWEPVVAAATALDPGAHSIFVFSGDEPDMLHSLQDGKWVACFGRDLPRDVRHRVHQMGRRVRAGGARPGGHP